MLAALALAGCAASTPEAPPSSPTPIVDPEFAARVDQLLLGEMSDAQRSVLLAAKQSGAVSQADMESLRENLFSCFESAGVQYEIAEPKEVAPGLFLPDYYFMTADDENFTGMAQADACLEQHFNSASIAFQQQPIALEFEEREFEAHRQEMISCLTENGVQIDSAAPRDEIESALIALRIETSNADPDSGGVWCDAWRLE
jgi:hypothetical protein